MGARPSRWWANPHEAAAALLAPQLFVVASENCHLTWSAVGVRVFGEGFSTPLFFGDTVRAAVLRYCLACGMPFPRRARVT